MGNLPPSSEFVVGGVRSLGWYDDCKRYTIKERVNVAGNMPFATLSQTWPAGSRFLYACIKNPSALTPVAASSAAATNAAIMGIALVSTAPTSLATNSATSNLLLSAVQTAFGAAIPSNSATRGNAALAATTAGGFTATSAYDQYQNKLTTDVTLYLVPYASTVSTDANGVGRFYVAGTTASTSQYNISNVTTSVNIDVEIYFEGYDDPPNN